MTDKNRDAGTLEKLRKHSLPGTNQAGKEPGVVHMDHDDRGGGRQHKEHLEKHSLPGTNQAGKGPTTENAE